MNDLKSNFVRFALVSVSLVSLTLLAEDAVPSAPPVASPAPNTPTKVLPLQTQPAVALPVAVPATPPDPKAIAWDADTKEYDAKPGDQNATFTFWLTNVSPNEVVINQVITSCGCTTAQLPPMPWKLASGTNGEIHVNMNIAGKTGTVVKTVTVNASTGSKVLNVKANVPVPPPAPATPVPPPPPVAQPTPAPAAAPRPTS